MQWVLFTQLFMLLFLWKRSSSVSEDIRAESVLEVNMAEGVFMLLSSRVGWEREEFYKEMPPPPFLSLYLALINS